MTALILQASPYVQMATPKLRSLYVKFLRALDAFAEARMRSAVPASQIRKVRREVDQCRRLMHQPPTQRLAAKPHRKSHKPR